MPDIAGLIVAALSTDYPRMARQARRNLILWSAVAILGLTAYVGAVAALAVYLSSIAGAAAALLTVAAGALTLALVLVAAILIGNRREREWQRRRAQSARAASMVNLGITALPLVLRARPLPSLAVAALAAFVVGLVMTGKKTDD